MARRKTLSDKGIEALKPRGERYAEPDPELVGHYVRVTPAGGKTFVAVARAPSGKQIWATIGAADLLTVEEARDKARDAIKRIRAGLPAFDLVAGAPKTFGDISGQWLTRHVGAKALRSEREIRRLLAVHVLPKWEAKPFTAIRRGDVADLLDEVEDEHSARQADAVLTIIRSIGNWYAARHDDYAPPVVRGMRRQDPRAQARARILDDAELKLIWRAAEAEGGPFGALVRVALLTAQRRTKVVAMRWEDLSKGEWSIPKLPREKDTAGSLVLPSIALSIIERMPRLNRNPYVFAGRGVGHFAGFSQAKTRFDARLMGVEPWVLHDLRRTARSLMARAGVRPDIAERVLGHAIAGVEGVYDRHSYRDEKADALVRLADLVRKIVG